MPAGPLLRSEPLQRYRAMGAAGDPVWRAAGQLRAALSQRLSREHADLLAIPEVDPSGSRIDWYAPFEGNAQLLTDLPESERVPILDRMRHLHADMARLADTLEAPERSGAERSFARLLRHALTAPGEETLHVVDGRPVMTFWGFSADAVLPGAFLGAPPAMPRPAPAEAILATAPAAVVAGRGMRTAWWQWLLLAALLLLLLALLAWLIRPYLPHLEPRLAAEARERALTLATQQPVDFQQTRMTSLLQDHEALRLELSRLAEEVSRRGTECSAGVILPGGIIVGTTDGTPIERGADPDAKADVAAAGTGEQKGPDQKNAEGATPPPGQQNGQAPTDDAKKDEPKPMVVPPEAQQKQDLAFLKGDWRSRTGLATAQGEKDLRPSYTLDDKGRGKVSFVQKNGAVCEAPAEARWDGSKLVIEEKTNPKCADGRTYARNTVNCEVDKDGVAQCKGSQPGDTRTYNVQIGR